MSLSDESLDSFPASSYSWWGRLVGKARVSPGGAVGHSILDEAALCVAGAEESGVDDDQDPGSFLEHDGGEQEAEPEGDFESGNDSHRLIVVVLDEFTDGVTDGRGLGLTAGRCYLGGRRYGGEKIRTSVGQDVKEGVDGEWEDSKRDLSGKEPDNCHD